MSNPSPSVAVILAGVVLLSSCAGVGDRSTSSKGAGQSGADSGHCTFTIGPGVGTVIVGRVVLDPSTASQRGIYVVDGLIQAIDEPDVVRARYSQASTLVCDNAYISPGFINPHEHTAYSYGFPDPATKPIYTHRDEWRLGLNGKYKIVQPAPSTDEQVLAWIELRHLMGGVTTVAGSGALKGMTKNVASAATPPYTYRVDLQTFPFGPTVMEQFAPYKCDPNIAQPPTPKLDPAVPPTRPYVGHVGEGTSCEARLEIDFLLDYLKKNPGRKFTMIHGVALEQYHIDRVKNAGVSVVWSPRSNLALYGKTVDGVWLIDSGVSVSLGTDWSPSGSFNILEEVRCARNYSHDRSARQLRGAELWSMVTANAADALGIGDRTGSIGVGKAADIVVLNDPSGKNIADFGSLKEEDIIAVFVDGNLMTGAQNRLTGDFITSRCPNTLRDKLVCVDFSQYQFSIADIEAKNANNVDVLSTNKEVGCVTGPTPLD